MPEDINLRNLGIQQLGKTRVVHHALEVVVCASLEPVPRVHFDGASEICKAILSTSGYGVEEREPIECVIGLGMGGKDAAELVASLFVEACIQLRDCVVIVFAWCCEDQFWPLQLALAGVDVHPATLFECDWSVWEEFFKGSQGFIEFALLKQLHGGLIKRVGGSCARARVTSLMGIRCGCLLAARCRGSGLLHHGFADITPSGRTD